jgi:hypothetical protein
MSTRSRLPNGDAALLLEISNMRNNSRSTNRRACSTAALAFAGAKGHIANRANR